MADVVIVLILIVIVGGAAGYIVKEKKKGTRCIGCPHSGTCGGKHCRGEKQVSDQWIFDKWTEAVGLAFSRSSNKKYSSSNGMSYVEHKCSHPLIQLELECFFDSFIPLETYMVL